MHGRLLEILQSRQARVKICQTDHKKAKMTLCQPRDTLELVSDNGPPYNSKEFVKIYYNRGIKDLPPLKRRHQRGNQRRWFKAKVEQKADIRSYIARTGGGGTRVQKKQKTLASNKGNIRRLGHWGGHHAR